VGQARLREGLSEVFRNLARRSQSLLHRQLALLDSMERRAKDPQELEELFRLDHLTTRMRRHAESLIILSGQAPARGWRHPVPLVDVLRAAVAEVEDYTRIRVICAVDAALTGAAVGDVIHLLAELAENATMYSPPNTLVVMTGDIVGQGFAIDIEDRGLGMSEERLAEINAQLAEPPPFDPSATDQLGLFVAAQLARRHQIRISLRSNPYGGATAIVLIPHALVVPAGAPGPTARALESPAPRERRAERGGARATGSGTEPIGLPFGGSAREAGPAHAAPGGPGPGGPIGAGRWAGTAARETAYGGGGNGHRDTAGLDPPPAGDSPDQGSDLPRRVRQASLAPQLRDMPLSAPVTGAAVDARSPEESRAALSAIQQGWQRGRSTAGAGIADPATVTGQEPEGPNE
jgi:hypothetical protein